MKVSQFYECSSLEFSRRDFRAAICIYYACSNLIQFRTNSWWVESKHVCIYGVTYPPKECLYVLNKTVHVVDSDWHFDNPCSGHHQSHIELHHVSWWYSTLVIELIVEACVAIMRLTPWTPDLEVRGSSLGRQVVSLYKELYSLSLFTQLYKWRLVTKILSCQVVITTSKREIKQVGISLVLFFFYFPLKVAGGHVHSSLAKSSAPRLLMTAL